MENALEVASGDPNPRERTEAGELPVMQAVRTRPAHEQLVTALCYYINGCARPGIVDSLDLPTGTVRPRLPKARATPVRA
jgi:hypothetical protein